MPTGYTLEEIRAKDATIAALREEVERLKEERDDAVATRIPPSSGALLDLGARLTELLDEDDWNNLEPLLLATKGSQEATEKERDALRSRLAVAEGKVDRVRRTINDPMVCEYQQMRNRLTEDIK